MKTEMGFSGTIRAFRDAATVLVLCLPFKLFSWKEEICIWTWGQITSLSMAKYRRYATRFKYSWNYLFTSTFKLPSRPLNFFWRIYSQRSVFFSFLVLFFYFMIAAVQVKLVIILVEVRGFLLSNIHIKVQLIYALQCKTIQNHLPDWSCKYNIYLMIDLYL